MPTECDVLIVCRQRNDKEWKFKEQHAKMWENIAGAKRYSRPRGFNTAGASASVAPAVPTPPDDNTLRRSGYRGKISPEYGDSFRRNCTYFGRSPNFFIAQYKITRRKHLRQKMARSVQLFRQNNGLLTQADGQADMTISTYRLFRVAAV